MTSVKRYYGLNLKQKVIDIGFASKIDAVRIIGERYINQKDFYKDDCEALADTMFGFGDEGKEGFLEISINGKNHTSLRFEYTKKYLNLLLFKYPVIVTCELVVTDIDQIKELTSHFFEENGEEFTRTMIKNGAAKS